MRNGISARLRLPARQLIALAVLAVVAGCTFPAQQTGGTEQLDPAYTVDANELLRAFVTDPDGAAAKYNDRVVAITGRVFDIGADPTGVPTFTFKSEKSDQRGIKCIANGRYPYTGNHIQLGDRVTMKGKIDGMDRNVIARWCVVM